MVYKCLNLFNLLPTSQPHLWRSAADWLEENNLNIMSNAFKESVFILGIINVDNWCGEEDGFGGGGGNGNGWGDSNY